MIIEKYYNNNGKTIYECDRCKKVIDTSKENRIRVHTQISQNSKYKNLNSWDFCERCYAALKRGIERGVVKK